jgi:hypothetical protein
MRLLLFLITATVLFSCKKELSINQTDKSSERRSTGPTVDLQIPRLDIGLWKYIPSDSVGLMAQDPILKEVVVNSYWSKMFNLPVGDTVMVIEYPCTIANYGYADWVINRDDFALYDSVNRDWLFDWLLELKLSKNGTSVATVLKQAFFFTSNQLLYDHPQIAIWYPWPNMWLAQRSGDKYINKMPVPSHRENGKLVADDGVYELAVTVNFKRTAKESNYRNNTGLLNFKIANNIATRDWTVYRKGRKP